MRVAVRVSPVICYQRWRMRWVTDIWLVRHGEAAAAFDQEIDPGLSPLGHEQAEAASQQLSTIVPEDAQLLSSPKQRALQTGAPFAAIRGVSCTTMRVSSSYPLRRAWRSVPSGCNRHWPPTGPPCPRPFMIGEIARLWPCRRYQPPR